MRQGVLDPVLFVLLAIIVFVWLDWLGAIDLAGLAAVFF
jgi:hypothetical protein